MYSAPYTGLKKRNITENFYYLIFKLFFFPVENLEKNVCALQVSLFTW